MIIAIIFGLLLLISGTSGVSTWETIQDFVSKNIIENYIVEIIFAVLIFIVSLARLSVIIGGILIGKNRIITVYFLRLLGAGLGLIDLIFSIIITIFEGSLTL